MSDFYHNTSIRRIRRGDHAFVPPTINEPLDGPASPSGSTVDQLEDLRIVTCPCGAFHCLGKGESWRCDCGLLCEFGKGHPAWCPMHGSVAARIEANQ